MQACYDKYGWKAFHFTVLEKCSLSQLDERESYFIRIFNTFESCYGLNMTSGGEERKEVSQHTRKLIGDKHRGKIISEAQRVKMKLARRGRKPALGLIHSDLVRTKMALAHGAKPFSIINENGEIITHCNKSKIAKQIGISRKQLRKLINDRTYSCLGWRSYAGT